MWARKLRFAFAGSYAAKLGSQRKTNNKLMEKEKICSVCRKIVKPPIQWWDKPYNACSDCVRKAALELQAQEKEKKPKIIKIKIKTLEPGFSPLPSMAQIEMLKAIQKILNWEFPVPIDQIKREQATDIINRAMKAAQRQKVNLKLEYNNGEDPEIRDVNEALQLL